MTREELHDEIMSMVRRHHDEHHGRKNFEAGDRINFAGRMYDAEKLVRLAAAPVGARGAREDDRVDENLADSMAAQVEEYMNEVI